MGNRLQLTRNQQQVTSYQYDAANRLTSVNGVAYTWDANGNLLSDGVRSYVYDHANRLVRVVALEWTDYKGSPNRAYASGYESRTFWVRQLDPAKYRQPWAVTITVGEGQRVGRGAVQPKKGGEVTTRVSVLLGGWPMRKLAARALDYIRTWELARRLLAGGVTSEIPKLGEEGAVVRDQQIPDGAGLLPDAEEPPAFTCEQCGEPIADCTTGGRTWTVSQLVDLAVAGARPLLCGVCLGKSENLTG